MLILVMGLPGSGKSFFAKKFAAKLGALYLNSDRLRKHMHSLGRYRAEDKLKVYQRMAQLAGLALAENKKVVVDATFHLRSMRELMFALARKKSLPVCCIIVQTTEVIIRERLRHPRKDSEADYSVYEIIRDQFEPIDVPHLVLDSTNHNLIQMLEGASVYLQDCYAEKGSI